MKKEETDQRGDRFPVRRLNRILTMLLSEMKDLSDEGRELPMRWHIMHMYSSSQLAVVLALRRGLNPELAGMAAALHDLGLVTTKNEEGHAEAAEKYVRDFFGRYHARTRGRLPEIMEEEENKIIKAIVRHGQKEVYSDDSLVELLKDVDSLDGYLHGGKAEGARLERVLRVVKELGIEKMEMGR
jgi:uncharacterized protein